MIPPRLVTCDVTIGHRSIELRLATKPLVGNFGDDVGS